MRLSLHLTPLHRQQSWLPRFHEARRPAGSPVMPRLKASRASLSRGTQLPAAGAGAWFAVDVVAVAPTRRRKSSAQTTSSTNKSGGRRSVAVAAGSRWQRGKAADAGSASPDLVEAGSGGHRSVAEEVASGSQGRGCGGGEGVGGRIRGGVGGREAREGAGGQIRLLGGPNLAASAAGRRGKAPVARSGFPVARSGDRRSGGGDGVGG
ncbi:hypothetical protein OsJ_34297 [Oryza sativa Japonica Group]|uniref:Uncharacterized protein n=1 Tax=Oryza sativa subsp. japonica TaxID=39947 RepID=B9GB93_ORYSJ|nr:hypothetical protein OsJ_34297 [Oryza sativa Japonica Group]